MRAGSLFRRLGELLRPGRGEEEGEPEGPVEELWSPEVLEPRRGRFLEERGPAWAAAYRAEGLELELAKEGLLAWASAPRALYDDFFAELEISFPPGEDYVAAGLIFRQAEEEDFYLLLLSSKGYVRLDVVFNGRPRPLVGWTEIPSRLAEPRAKAGLGLLAQGSRFVVFVDGEWVAEAEDETNRVGTLAFAARSFDTAGREPLRFRLESILVESRKLEVEALRRRLTLVQAPEEGARKRLAETFLAMGHYLPAAVQVKKIGDRRPLGAEELLLKAEIDLRLGLLEEAAAALDASLALEPGRPEAVLEKANLLYRRSLFPELRALVEGLGPEFRDNSRIALLLGHARSNLGDWAGAAEAYGRAAKLEPEEPLLRGNQARALEMAGRRPEAAEAWFEAGKGYFAREEADELALAEANLGRLERHGPRYKALKARSLFLAGKAREALELAETLVEMGSEDPVLSYLAGLLRVRAGRRREAARHYERACALAPDEALFAWRRAENLWELGDAEAGPLVEEALERHPEEGWTLNLAARLDLERLEREEFDEARRGELLGRARRRLEAAAAALPGEKAPLLNLAELHSLEGRSEEALETLAAFEGDGEARNLRGNILCRRALELRATGDGEGAERAFLSAEREYRRALELEGEKAEYRENLASLLVELERWTDAEAELRRALELGPGPRSYLLAGNLAELLGDWTRAEAAYRVGLESFAGDRNLLLALGRLWILRRDWKKAADCAERLAVASPEAAARLRTELREASTEALACSSCAREWRVPRELPLQSSASVRGMPPDEAPAGLCPSCGKIFCIGCAKEHLEGTRFTCPHCGEYLKLSDDRLRWLVREALKTGAAS